MTQVVLTDIRCKAMWAQNGREKLREKILAQKESAGREKLRTLQAELSAIDRRLPELDWLVQSAYEDKVLGKIPEIFAFSFSTAMRPNGRPSMSADGS